MMLSLYFASYGYGQNVNYTISGTVKMMTVTNRSSDIGFDCRHRTGNVTDIDGKYTLDGSLVTGDYRLVVGYTGYSNQEIAFTINQNNPNFSLDVTLETECA